MNIVSVRIYQYSIELYRPLLVHGKLLKTREGLILHLKSDQGVEGFGEIAPLPGFSQETLLEALNQIRSFKAQLCAEPIPEKIYKLNGNFDKWLSNSELKPSVRFGIESAVLGLIANAKNISLARLLSAEPHSKVRVAGLLQGPIEEIAEQTRDLLAQGFTEMKLKVGKDIDEAVNKVNIVNDIIYGKALLHLDANQAWNYDEAVTFGKTIGCAAVNYIEEPFTDITRIPEFFDETMIPVALDESIQNLTFDDIRSISGVDILVLKPTVLGGIEKTTQIIAHAENFALDTIISSSFESSIGISILAHLAGGSLRRHPVAGLNTLKWFKKNILNQPLLIENGGIQINEKAISASDINFDRLDELK